MLVRERERVIDVPHTTAQGLCQRDQLLEVPWLSADEVDQDNGVLGVQDDVRHGAESRGIRSHRCRCLLHIFRWHLKVFAGKFLFL